MKTDRSVLNTAGGPRRMGSFPRLLLPFVALAAGLPGVLGGCAAPGPEEGDEGSGAWTVFDAVPAALADEEDAAPRERPAEPPSTLTVEEAVAEALTFNRSVLVARLGETIGGTFERETRAQLLPRVTARGIYDRIDEAPKTNAPELGTSFTVGPRDVYGIRFDMNFPIYAFGRHLNAYREAVLRRHKSAADREAAESDVAAAVTAASFDLLEGIRAIDVAKSNEAALLKTVEDSRALLEAGTVTRSAVLEAEVEYEQARREREKLESIIPILRMSLNKLLGRPAKAPIEIVDDPVTRPPVWNEEALAEEALALRPELRASRLEVHALEKGLRAAIANELPELRGNLSWENDNSPFGNPTDAARFLLTLDIPLFTGGARYARIDRARYELEAASLQLQDLETDVRTEVASAYRDVVEAFQDIGVAERNIAKAEESLRIQREKFQNGRATSREVLESNALLTDSRFSYVAALYDYNIALRNLHRARGADPRLSPLFELTGEGAGETADAGADGGAGPGGGGTADVVDEGEDGDDAGAADGADRSDGSGEDAGPGTGEAEDGDASGDDGESADADEEAGEADADGSGDAESGDAESGDAESDDAGAHDPEEDDAAAGDTEERGER